MIQSIQVPVSQRGVGWGYNTRHMNVSIVTDSTLAASLAVYGRLLVSPCNNSRPAQRLTGNIRRYFIAAERADRSKGLIV